MFIEKNTQCQKCFLIVRPLQDENGNEYCEECGETFESEEPEYNTDMEDDDERIIGINE